MGRFSRESGKRGDEEFLALLPGAFTLDDLLSAVSEDAVHRALTWLYAGVERGDIVPNVDDVPIVYQVAGRTDEPRETPASRAPS